MKLTTPQTKTKTLYSIIAAILSRELAAQAME